MTEGKNLCLYCGCDSEQVPLLAMQYRDAQVWICPQHLPILIHEPAKLADKLPGAEDLNAAPGHDHH
jgi:hypothetical protein